MQAAYCQNINLRVAGMRILEARALRGVAVGELFPQTQTMNGGYARAGVSENVANRVSTPQRWFDQWNHGFGLAWEIDFWGRFRRAVESADAELDSSVENYDDVLVLLLAETASSYVNLRTYQERLGYAVKNVASQENALRIAEDKLRHGAATQRDVEQARTVLEQTRALIPQFEQGIRTSNNQLCVLLGLPPQDLVSTGLGDAAIPRTPPDVAVGIPADLIRRRPDVRKYRARCRGPVCTNRHCRIGFLSADFHQWHFGLVVAIVD